MSLLFLLLKEMGTHANRRLYYEPGMQWEGWLRGAAIIEGRGMAPQIRRAYDIARREHLVPPTMEQPQYNMFHRDKVEVEFAPLYDEIGLGTTI